MACPDCTSTATIRRKGRVLTLRRRPFALCVRCPPPSTGRYGRRCMDPLRASSHLKCPWTGCPGARPNLLTQMRRRAFRVVRHPSDLNRGACRVPKPVRHEYSIARGCLRAAVSTLSGSRGRMEFWAGTGASARVHQGVLPRTPCPDADARRGCDRQLGGALDQPRPRGPLRARRGLLLPRRIHPALCPGIGRGDDRPERGR